MWQDRLFGRQAEWMPSCFEPLACLLGKLGRQTLNTLDRFPLHRFVAEASQAAADRIDASVTVKYQRPCAQWAVLAEHCIPSDINASAETQRTRRRSAQHGPRGFSHHPCAHLWTCLADPRQDFRCGAIHRAAVHTSKKWRSVKPLPVGRSLGSLSNTPFLAANGRPYVQARLAKELGDTGAVIAQSPQATQVNTRNSNRALAEIQPAAYFLHQPNWCDAGIKLRARWRHPTDDRTASLVSSASHGGAFLRPPSFNYIAGVAT